MAKYSFEFKKKIVTEYLNGQGSTPYLSDKYGLGSKSQLKRWINAYQKYGDEGLLRSRKKQTYSFEFKLHVVELYLSTEVSYQDLALSVGINNPPLIAKWVNEFRVAGSDALRPKKKGRKKSLNLKDKKNNNSVSPEITPVDTSAKHVRQLEDENLKLRIENAY
ncbi:MAG: transposase, partial [Bacilli bacterium]